MAGGRRFKQVDVFTGRALFGNPVAVVLDGDGIDDATMQRLAAWTNLSETTFVLRPTVAGADYRLRIFSPRGELPFAGHPTIGSAHAVLEAGVVAARDGEIRQECAAGVLPIRVGGDGLSVRVPEPRVVREARIDPAELGRALGVPVDGTPLAIDVGPVWIVARIGDEASLRALTPDQTAVERTSRAGGATGVTVFAPPARPGAPIAVRSFAPAAGIAEDPVCGSGNAAVGAWLAATGALVEVGDAYRASQGRELGRDGEVRVRVDDGGRTIAIGGRSVTVIDGVLALD